MKVLYVTCISDQHLRAVEIFFRKYFRELKLSFKLGILTVPPVNYQLLSRLSKYVEDIIIDNGAYRGKVLNIETLINVYENVQKYFKNVRVILPDSLENVEETVRFHRDSVRYLKYVDSVNISDFIPVLQGKSFDEYVQCYRMLTRQVYGHGLKSPKTVAIGGLKAKRPSERRRILEPLLEYLIRRNRQVHILGLDLRDLNILKKHRNITADTANWTWEITKGGIPLPTGNRILIREDDEYWRKLPWEEKLALALYMKLLSIACKTSP